MHRRGIAARRERARTSPQPLPRGSARRRCNRNRRASSSSSIPQRRRALPSKRCSSTSASETEREERLDAVAHLLPEAMRDAAARCARCSSSIEASSQRVALIGSFTAAMISATVTVPRGAREPIAATWPAHARHQSGPAHAREQLFKIGERNLLAARHFLQAARLVPRRHAAPDRPSPSPRSGLSTLNACLSLPAPSPAPKFPARSPPLRGPGSLGNLG